MDIIFVTPILVRGKNGRTAFDREYHNIYYVSSVIPFEDIFTDNKNNYCYLTIRGAKYLDFLAKSDKIGFLGTYAIDDSEINFGINGENTVKLNLTGFVKSNKTDDLNGIDGYFFERPVQIKSCVHGFSEYYSNILEGNNKRNGISVINASIKSLYEIMNK